MKRASVNCRKIVVKKKFESRYGCIEIKHTHIWADQSKYQITPYMQELALYAGQEDNFHSASEGLQKYLRNSISSSQIDRLVKNYGQELEVLERESSEGLRGQVSTLSEQTKGYVMMDGCMLLTRQKGEWREMKLGRIFTSDTHYKEVSKERNWIKESIYTAHFGDYEAFLKKLEPLVDEYEPLKERLIFVNDGAKWIWRWVSENYPSAIQILDFFHAVEYLAEFAKAVFKNKEKRTEWITEQQLLLLNDEVEKIIEKVRTMACRSEGQKAAQKKIHTYYLNNKERMQYKTYKEKGLLIGSGPIESAHRTVIQKRLKQSGQRWTKKGAQYVANLRVSHKNGQWNNVIKLIGKAA